VLFGDAYFFDYALVRDERAILSDDADTEFRPAWCTKLAGDEDVERRLEGAGDLVPTGTPPLGRARTTGRSCPYLSSRSASLLPASSRSLNAASPKFVFDFLQ
jgi:hypothetical protein